jgi:hypothetical protein
MARQTETLDPTTETNGAAPTETEDAETKSKRERVDLETLDPMERVQFNITIPAGLKLAYLKAGEERGLAGSYYARNILAQALEYTIPESFDERTRKRTYASDEERKAETAKRAKEQREQLKAMLKLMKEGKLDPSMLQAAMPS